MESKKPRFYKSKIVEQLMWEMDNSPWYVKLGRWIRLKIWVYRCLIFNRR